VAAELILPRQGRGGTSSVNSYVGGVSSVKRPSMIKPYRAMVNYVFGYYQFWQNTVDKLAE